MSLGAECHLTSLCFADDVVLIAASAHQLREIIADLRTAAAARGLKIHSGKAKELTNSAAVSSQSLPESLKVDEGKHKVLDFSESTQYLGRKVCYKDPQESEFDNRVAKAWGAFSRHKQELGDRRHRLKDRLKLFDAVVMSTLLYGCETWTLKVDQERRLGVLQRKMLRLVLNAKRRPVVATTSSETDKDEEDSEADELEPWRDFLRRTAQWTDEELEKAKLKKWTVQW